MRIYATEGTLGDSDAFLTIHCQGVIFTGTAKRAKLTVMTFQPISRDLHNALKEQFPNILFVDSYTFRLSEADWAVLSMLTEH